MQRKWRDGSGHGTAGCVKAKAVEGRRSVRNPKGLDLEVWYGKEGLVCLNDRFNLCHLDTIRFSLGGVGQTGLLQEARVSCCGTPGKSERES